ncbi:LysR family transcriptional regulator [Epibacterium ulvae]|uniref:LysR family transcriptional regulator n=1 Tax=Epibacterium ulvae TaxID=1156985 RepID=UPI001BFC2C2D|nr:LysR family transcriptional regulator [Epibacterium ulvae]MBT8154996.1 LysR family transcriptional regulator [Epibacterium ulvae]
MHDKLLIYLDEVARHGSIRKAAAVLNVASSSVNRKILNFEESLGIRLFVRHADGVELTEAGSVVLEHCRKTLFDYQKIVSQIEDIGELRSGHIHIATLDSVAHSLLPSVLDQFSKKHPGINYTIQTAQPDEVMMGVADGDFNIGISFCKDLVPGVRVHSEKATPIGAILRPDHPMAERDALEVEDLAAFKVLRSFDGHGRQSLLNEAITEAHAKLPLQMVTNSLPLARSLVLKNHGIGIYSKIGFLDEIEQGLLRYITILSPVLKDLKIGVLTSSRSHPSPATHLMCRSLSKALKALKLDS